MYELFACVLDDRHDDKLYFVRKKWFAHGWLWNTFICIMHLFYELVHRGNY